MRMKHWTITLGAGLMGGVLLIAPRPNLSAATPIMPVAEIRPGMTGLGRTVFDGTRVEEFKVHILGVIENVMGPQRTLVLSRLEGGPLAQTGVIAGMSGSPVYIDGRLVGAISYSLGSFSKEPIAGITPISEMTADAAVQIPRPAASRVRVDFPVTPDNVVAAVRKALIWNRPFASRTTDARFSGVGTPGGFRGSELGPMLRPIAVPLVMSGFDSDLTDLLGMTFREQGFVPMAAGAAGRPGEMPYEGPLKAGDAVGVNFVTGDFLLGATGTVTMVDEDRVYAFGHPMYNLGPTDFPMTRAYVYTVLPSLSSSSKLSTTGETIGIIQQDRPTTIAGRLGPGPKMIPVTVVLRSDHAAERTFSFNVVKDQLFTPLMTSSVLANLFASYERQFGASTFAVQGKVLVARHGTVTFDNLFSGESPSGGAASSVIAPLAALVGNDYEPIDIEKLDVVINTSEEERTATLERIWIDDPRPRAGRTVPVKVLLRPHRGEDFIRTVPIEIPANASGTLSLLVTDGLRLSQSEQREARLPQPRSVPQLVRALNRERRNDRLYVRLLSSQPGAVVNGELLASLPPSVLAIIEGDRSTGGAGGLNSATLGEWEIPTEQAITGTRTLTISVAPN
jgi:hypothetical protein